MLHKCSVEQMLHSQSVNQSIKQTITQSLESSIGNQLLLIALCMLLSWPDSQIKTVSSSAFEVAVTLIAHDESNPGLSSRFPA